MILFRKWTLVYFYFFYFHARMYSSYHFFNVQSTFDEHTFHSTMLNGIKEFNECKSKKGDRLCALDPDFVHKLSLANVRFNLSNKIKYVVLCKNRTNLSISVSFLIWLYITSLFYKLCIFSQDLHATHNRILETWMLRNHNDLSIKNRQVIQCELVQKIGELYRTVYENFMRFLKYVSYIFRTHASAFFSGHWRHIWTSIKFQIILSNKLYLLRLLHGR